MFEIGDTVEVIEEHSSLPLGSTYTVLGVFNKLLRISYSHPSGLWWGARFKIIKKGSHDAKQSSKG